MYFTLLKNEDVLYYNKCSCCKACNQLTKLIIQQLNRIAINKWYIYLNNSKITERVIFRQKNTEDKSSVEQQQNSFLKCVYNHIGED
jgi:hypothetical protein